MFVGMFSQMMVDAPFSIALSMKVCPSVCVPLTATKICPFSIERESMLIPVISIEVYPMI